MKLTNNELKTIIENDENEKKDLYLNEKIEEEKLREFSKKDLSQTKEFKTITDVLLEKDPNLVPEDIYIHYHWAVDEYCLYVKNKWICYVFPES